MKNIWLLIRTNIRRNYLAVLIAVFSAVALCLILNAMGQLEIDVTLSKVSIGLIDYDNSKLSEDFKNYLKDHLNYDLIEIDDYDRLSTELIDKKISVIMEIPKGFYEQYSLGSSSEITVTSLDDYENAAFFEVYINNYLSSIQILSKGADGDQKIFNQLLEDNNLGETKITQTSALTIDKQIMADKAGFVQSNGFFLMFIFSISIILSFMVIDDRLNGVFNRIQASPVTPIQYVLGSGIFGMILCFIVIGIYFGYISLADIHTGIPFGVSVILMSLFSLFTVSFSLAVALAIKSKNAIISAIIGFSTIGCVLGGAYFPIDMSPKSLQNLASVLPQFWYMDTLRNLQADASFNYTPNIIILVLFTVLSLLVGAVLFSQHYKNN